MKKKILLYNPLSVFYDMPLALLSIASIIDKNQFEIVIIDARIVKNVHDEILKHIHDAICFGVTVLTGKPLKDAMEVTKWVKDTKPDIKTIWGGWHPSLFPIETLEQEESIDITVQGQGEITFKELVDCFDKNLDLAKVNGICYRYNNKIVQNKPRTMTKMNDLPQVNYDQIDVEKYFQLKGKRQFDYISSIGCHFRCTFCADPFVFERSWSGYDANRMINDLKSFKEKYNFIDVNFQDETFFTLKSRSTEFAQKLIDEKLNISWAATMRADQHHRLGDEEFLKIVQSGFRRALIGVESGSQEMLDWLKKDIKIEHILHAAKKAKEAGISAIFPFIVGFPNESDESILKSLKFAAKLRSMSPNFQTPIFYFKPYPGSEITNKVNESGFTLPKTLGEWSEFDYVGGKSGPWVNEKMFKLVERFKFYNKLAFHKHYLVFYLFTFTAQIRLKKLNFNFPVSYHIAKIIRKEQELS